MSSLEGNGTHLEGVCHWAMLCLWSTPPFLSSTSLPWEGIKVLLSNVFTPINSASPQADKYRTQQPWTKPLISGTERKCPILQICSLWKNITNRTFMYFKPAGEPGQQDISKQLFCPWPILPHLPCQAFPELNLQSDSRAATRVTYIWWLFAKIHCEIWHVPHCISKELFLNQENLVGTMSLADYIRLVIGINRTGTSQGLCVESFAESAWLHYHCKLEYTLEILL